ncbi:putative cytosolic oligopeptidase A [Hordeum vulgare]|nr:putative cytosolic oligopeptidase A [Hordeum vulgare]
MADADNSNNPLLADFDFPPFDRVEPSHIRPGIRALLARLEGELEELEKGVEPAWERLVHPLERIVDRLDIVRNIVDHLKAVKDSPNLCAAVEDVQARSFRPGPTEPTIISYCIVRSPMCLCFLLLHELSSNAIT